MESNGRQSEFHYGEYAQLLSARAVRERCHYIGELALAGNAHWFRYNPTHVKRCVDLVAQTCKQHYPHLNIPLHSRWRHFVIDGVDLWDHYTKKFRGKRIALSRSAVDLIFVSVLLDGGAGEKWSYSDAVSGKVLRRSEGLAAASMDLFFNHVASFDKENGWWISPESLDAVTARSLSNVFQHSMNNPLTGVEGRVKLLHGLAKVLRNEGQKESGLVHPGAIVDECLSISRFALSRRRRIDITQVLEIILKRFSYMWPSGFCQDDLNLGDCGRHSGLTTDDRTSGIVPFHKLSQWLTYSLVEPLQWAGLKVMNLDGLTGLAEYRNGGLFIDTGVLQPLDAGLLDSKLKLDSEAVVEWRALTVFMLDRLAGDLRKSLNLSEKNFPLSSVLQGGTWATGRGLAARLRDDGSAPINLDTDGTIF